MTRKYSYARTLRGKARRLYGEASTLECAAQEIDMLRKTITRLLRIVGRHSDMDANERRWVREASRVVGATSEGESEVSR